MRVRQNHVTAALQRTEVSQLVRRKRTLSGLDHKQTVSERTSYKRFRPKTNCIRENFEVAVKGCFQ